MLVAGGAVGILPTARRAPELMQMIQLHWHFILDRIPGSKDEFDRQQARICWSHGEETYPGLGYKDFGVVLLPWWLTATLDLYHHGCAQFDFMDDPYQMRARATGRTVELSFERYDRLWSETPEAFARCVVDAAEIAMSELASVPFSETWIADVRRNIRVIKEYFRLS